MIPTVTPAFLNDMAGSGIKILGLMDGIRKRPDMYFAAPDIDILHAFVMGVEMSERCHKIEGKSLLDIDLHEFEMWVRKKLRRKSGSIRSFYLARQKTHTNKEAFYLWLDWYDEYVAKHDTI